MKGYAIIVGIFLLGVIFSAFVRRYVTIIPSVG